MVAALADTRCIDSDSIVEAAIPYDADPMVAAFGSRCAGILLKLVVGGHCSSTIVHKEGYRFTHSIQYIHSLRLLLQNLLADLLSNTVLILIKTGVTEITQYLHSLRLYLHNLLADIIDLLGYTVLILIKTGVTEIEI